MKSISNLWGWRRIYQYEILENDISVKSTINFMTCDASASVEGGGACSLSSSWIEGQLPGSSKSRNTTVDLNQSTVVGTYPLRGPGTLSKCIAIG